MRSRFTPLLSYLFAALLFSFGPAAWAQDDAGIAAITQPSGTVCRGAANVDATLHNYGALNIVSVTIQWSVNGMLQTPVNYSGTLIPGADTTLTLGSYNFNAGSYTIIAYSENPNGNTDIDNSNDTSSASVSTQLSGVYTLGGASPDFADFTSAVNDLNSVGICGTVTFNVRPGTYTEKLLINQIAGASDTSTITFQSENGDSSSVILNTPSVDSTLANNYLIRLNGTDYLRLKQLTLTRSGISANARVLDYTNVASYNIITNCHLIGVNNGITANSLGALVYSSGGTPFNDSMNTFTNNLLENGSIGIYFNGVGTLSLENGTVIDNNEFINQFAFAMQLSYQQAPVITNNYITSNATAPSYYGIYLSACLRNTNVSKNQVANVAGNGFYFIDCGAFPVPRGVIANNFVHTTDSSGITLLNGGNLDVIYNSVHVQGATATNAALALRGVNYGMAVKNNALVNSGGGYAYVIADSAFAGLVHSNYNDLYSTGSNVGNYRGANEATLADWQTAAAHDTNSVSVDPAFISASDLHATSLAMDNLGTPDAAILVDIDNDVRSATTPDIGADEYSGQGHDVGVTALVSPVDNECESASTVVSVIVHNYGAFTESNVPVQVDITGDFNGILSGSISSLPSGADSTLVFSTTLNTSGGGDLMLTAYTQLATDDVHANDTLHSATIHINAVPAAPVVTGDTLCGPGSLVLTATSGDSLFWYDAATGGTLLGQGSPFNTPFISATTTFYVEARNICSSVRVAVDAVIRPLANINLGNDTSILMGSSITLDAGAGYVSYSWSTGETTQSITDSPATSTCYNVMVTDTNGCSSADTICVTVIFPTDAGISALLSPIDHQCEDAVTLITVNVTNFGSASAIDIPIQVDITGSITATFNDTLLGTLLPGATMPFTIDSTINTMGAGAFTITVYTQYLGDMQTSNDTIVAVINVNAVPLPPAGVDNSRCGPGPITISGTATDTIYWFDEPSGGNLLAIGTNYIPFLAVTDTFYAQTGFNCPSTTRTAVIATILPLPVVNLGPDTLIECGASLTLDAGAGYSMYQWSNAATSQTIVVDTLGDYSVTVVDTAGCVNSDTIHVDCVVSVAFTSGAEQVNVFPNPSSGLVTVEFGNSPVETSLRWLDLQGQIIIEENLHGTAKRVYDLSSLNKGLYLLQVISPRGVSIHRILIQ